MKRKHRLENKNRKRIRQKNRLETKIGNALHKKIGSKKIGKKQQYVNFLKKETNYKN